MKHALQLRFAVCELAFLQVYTCCTSGILTKGASQRKDPDPSCPDHFTKPKSVFALEDVPYCLHIRVIRAQSGLLNDQCPLQQRPALLLVPLHTQTLFPTHIDCALTTTPVVPHMCGAAAIW